MTTKGGAIEGPTRPTLASLALLKAQWDRPGRRRDFIGSFLPFAAHCMRANPTDVVTVSETKQCLKTHFGLRIPHHAVSAILAVASRERLVSMSSGVMIRDPTKLDGGNFETRRDEMLAKYDAVVAGLREHVRTIHQVEWSSTNADAALRAFLHRQQLNFPKPNLLATVIPGGRRLKPTDRYLVASFISTVVEGDSPVRRALESIVQGNMLAGALFLPEPGQAAARFRRTTCYLDTTLIIRALGYQGPDQQGPATELLDLLHRTGARLACFRHTYGEIERALRFCARELAARNPVATLYGPGGDTVRHFRQTGVTSSDVELMLSSLTRSLEMLRVDVVETQPYRDDRHSDVIDHDALLVAFAAEFPNTGRETLNRDVESLASVARERAGRSSDRVEQCVAVFITSNTRLVRRANAFLHDGGSGVPLALSDVTLTNLVWLKAPTQAPDLPLKRLIADVYAALQPDDDLWSALDRETTKLKAAGTITADDYYDLRYSLASQDNLMELTAGDAGLYRPGTAVEVLRRVQEERVEQARKTVSAELSETRAHIHKLNTHEQIRRSTLTLRARTIARGLVIPLYLIGCLAIGAAVALPLVGGSSLALGALGLGAFVCIVFYAAMGGLSTAFGSNWHGAFVAVSEWLEPRVLSLLTRLTGDTND